MLNNMAFRHRRAARKQMQTQQAPAMDYIIVAPSHKPDLRGEFAGVKVRRENGKQIVRLTVRQARFYLDQGAIVPKPMPEAPKAATEPKKGQ